MSPNLIFLDTETTDRTDGRLIQLAYKLRGDKDISVEFYKPPVPIQIEAMAVHHITEKQVANLAPFAGSATYKKLQTILPASILVAHNAQFDIGILKHEGVASGRYICTMKIAQSMYDLPMYKMQYLRYLWGIEDDGAVAHDAGGDVAILEKIFDHMLQEYAATNKFSEADTIEKFIEISKNPVLLRRVPFGQYAGKTFAELKAADPGYLQWMNTLKDKGEDFSYTVNYYLSSTS
jgi:DNA polymerase III epsilon subunit-like protein